MSDISTFTSESVSQGHPDKVADQISDGVLDAIIEQDPNCRVACETAVNTGLVLIFGEVTTSAEVDYPDVARNVIKEIGYDDPSYGFDNESCSVQVALDKQSEDIAQGVDGDDDADTEQGAGDQGLMFGYACNETDQYMPMPIVFSNQLVRRQAEIRHEDGGLDFLGPDAKSQVSVRYDGHEPVAVDAVVLSTQHEPDIGIDEVRQAVRERIIEDVIPADLLHDDTKFHINPTGRFVTGGPVGDAGLTGRKIIVDTYGGMGRHGGGAFSGKDPSKVDRSAAYMARHVAKNVVAAGLADRCEVQFSYAIGVAEPVSIMVDTFGTAEVAEENIEQIIPEFFELKPAGLIESLDLLKPIYQDTAAYGHFGRSQFSWEKVDKAAQLKEALG